MRRSALAALAVMLASPAWAGLTLTGKPKVSFQATGTVMDMEGVGSTVKLADDGATLSFAVPMASVSTDNALRDDHMHNTYVEVAKFPDVVVSFDKAAFKLPAAAGEKLKGSVSGTLTVHGVSQPVTVSYTAKRGEASTKVEASFSLDVSKHGIVIPEYLGVTLDPKMKATASLELIDG